MMFQTQFHHNYDGIRLPQRDPTASDLALDILGERFVFSPERAVYWPSASTLIISDLHFGKEMTLRRQGQAMPEFTLEYDLQRLSQLVTQFAAKHLLILGDCFHHSDGITAETMGAFSTWRRSHAITMATLEGNHDVALREAARALDIEWLGTQWQSGRFTFIHGDQLPGEDFTWSGHYHPCLRVKNSFDRVRLPAFYIDSHQAILPSFGSATGGFPLPKAMQGLAIAVSDAKLHPFSHGKFWP